MEDKPKEKLKQLQVKESVWQSIEEIKRYLSYSDHTNYSTSDVLYELIITWENLETGITKVVGKQPGKKKKK